jgi:hypothetical protein
MMKGCNGSSLSKIVFKGRHFDRQIIVLCVSRYTSFKLSLRDLVIMMPDRGISVTHTTILRWVQRYLPEFENAGGATLGRSADRGRGTRPILRFTNNGVPIPRRRQNRSDGRFLSQLEPGRERGQVVSAERNEEHSRANEDHLGCLCGLAPGGARDEGRRRNFRVASWFDPVST